MDLASRTLSGVKSFVSEMTGSGGTGKEEGEGEPTLGEAQDRICYSIGFLKALKYSDLIEVPTGLPPVKEWFGEDDNSAAQAIPSASASKQHLQRQSHDQTRDRYRPGESLDDGGDRALPRRREREPISSTSFSPNKESYMSKERHNGLPARRFDDHTDGTGAGNRSRNLAGKEPREKEGPRTKAWHDKLSHEENERQDGRSGRSQSNGSNWREAPGGRSDGRDGRDWVPGKGNDHRRERNLDATRSATFTNKFGRLGEQDHQRPAWIDDNAESPHKTQSNRTRRFRDYEAEEDAKDAETFGSLDDAMIMGGDGGVPDLAHWSQDGVDEMQAFKERMKRDQERKKGPETRSREVDAEKKDQPQLQSRSEAPTNSDTAQTTSQAPVKIVEVPSVRSSRFAKYFSEKQPEDAAQASSIEALTPASSNQVPSQLGPPPGLEALMANASTKESVQDHDMMRVMAMLGGQVPQASTMAAKQVEPPQAIAHPKSQQPQVNGSQSSNPSAVPPPVAKQRSRFFGGDVPTAVLRAGKGKGDKERGNSGSPSGSRPASPGPQLVSSSMASVPAIAPSQTSETIKASRPSEIPHFAQNEAPPPWMIAQAQGPLKQAGPPPPPPSDNLRTSYAAAGSYPMMAPVQGGRPTFPYDQYPPPPPPHMMYGHPPPAGIPFMRGHQPPPPANYHVSPSSGSNHLEQHYMAGPGPGPGPAPAGHGQPPGLEPFTRGPAMHNMMPPSSSQVDSHGRSGSGPPSSREVGPQQPQIYQAGFPKPLQGNATNQKQNQNRPPQSGQPDLMRLLLGSDK